MALALPLTALLMGLAGAPHCVAMCGAACGALVGRGDGAAQPVRFVSRDAGRASGGTFARVAPATQRMFALQLGRLLGYSVAGGAAALAVGSFASFSQTTAALQPLWTMFHLAVLAWGLMLVLRARQPAWVELAGRGVWDRVRPFARSRGGLLASGAAWAFMPCGLLYSALLVASLAGSAVEGALCMALFALGSGVSLGFAPRMLRWVGALGERVRDGGGTRLAGGVLVVTAAWALWMDVAKRVALWCA